jgi:hypothetical protein
MYQNHVDISPFLFFPSLLLRYKLPLVPQGFLFLGKYWIESKFLITSLSLNCYLKVTSSCLCVCLPLTFHKSAFFLFFNLFIYLCLDVGD